MLRIFSFSYAEMDDNKTLNNDERRGNLVEPEKSPNSEYNDNVRLCLTLY